MISIKSFCKLSSNAIKAIFDNKISLYSKTDIAFRCLSTTSEPNDDMKYVLPPLMHFPPKGVPNVFYSLKNHFIVHFFLKPMIDNDFNYKNFINGSKQALSVIATNLSNDNIDGIKDMVTNEAYEEISENFKKFSSEQKEKLRVAVEDIIFAFAYDIDIERQSNDSAIVKIFVISDVLPQFNETMRSHFVDKDITFPAINEFIEHKFLCNYEFIRHYVKGVQSDWIVSKLLHLSDKDILRYYGFIKR